MRRHVAILSSFLLLAVVSVGASRGARAAIHPACSMLTVYAHGGGALAYNFCISVNRTAPGASTITGIRIFSPGLENESKDLASINQGFSPISGGEDLLLFKGNNVTADAGGNITITYKKSDGTKDSVIMNLAPQGGDWITQDNSGMVNLADIEVGMTAGISIKSLKLSRDPAILKL